jgi:hypothetical protein
MGLGAPMPDPSPHAVSAALRGRAVRHLLHAVHPALPRPLDLAAERWARLPPRLRILAGITALLMLVGATEARVHSAERRWGGEPVTVWVASADAGVGEPPGRLEPVRMPPAIVPPHAVTRPPRDVVLSLPLLAGAVLTDTHLTPAGPAAGLGPKLRALPIAVEENWGVVAGGWVDIWVLGPSRAAESLGAEADGSGPPPRQAVARSRPVLEVRDDGLSSTALVGLDLDEVEAVTTALADRGLLLTHAPPPEATED